MLASHQCPVCWLQTKCQCTSKQHKHDSQPQTHPSDEDTPARGGATATGHKQKRHASTNADESASEAGINTPTVKSDKAAANPPVQASESVSKQATADKDSADTHKRRRKQQRTKAAAKLATTSQMPKQAASQKTAEESRSVVHSSQQILPPAGSIVKDAVSSAPVPGGKPQAAQSLPQLQKPSPESATGASRASASLKPSSANAPSPPPSDPSTPLAPAPSQLQSALSLSPPSTPKASNLASDPLAFLLGQAPFSPSGIHANQPITKPAATITTSSAPDVTQAAVQTTAAGVAKAAPVRVYSPPPVPVLPTFEGSGKRRKAGTGAAADMGDDCIVCWATKRSTLLAVTRPGAGELEKPGSIL